MSYVAAYIESLAIPSPKRGPALTRTEDLPAFSAERQAIVIGSQLAEFTPDLPKNIRPVISDSLLLAHLAADKANSGREDPASYLTTFNTVLGRIGWLPVGGAQAAQDLSNTGLELNKAIIPVLIAALGPAAAASSILISVLSGLHSMNEDSPWFTLFSRRSQTVHAAQFGLNYVDAGDGGGALLKSVLCSVTATSTLTQVLFAKFSTSTAKVTANRRDAELSASAMQAAAPSLQSKIAGHLAENIAAIDI